MGSARASSNLVGVEGPFFTSLVHVGDWSSGMIPALGAGGREFDSRITPFFGVAKKSRRPKQKEEKNSPMRGSNPRLAG